MLRDRTDESLPIEDSITGGFASATLAQDETTLCLELLKIAQLAHKQSLT